MRTFSSSELSANHDWCRRAARTTTRRRSGIALLVVLVALGIVSTIGMTLLRMSLMHHRQAQREAFVVQSRWLAESAFDQAVLRLKSGEKLTRTTWKVSAKELDGRHSAVVTVEVREVENAPQQRQVVVVADFPIEVSKRSRTVLDRSVIP